MAAITATGSGTIPLVTGSSQGPILGSVTDGLQVATSQEATWTHVLADALETGDGVSALLRALQTINDELAFADATLALYRALISDTFSLSGAPSGAAQYARTVIDALKLHGAFSQTVDSRVAITMALAIHDAIVAAQRGTITSSMDIAAAIEATALHIAELFDSWSVTDVTTPRALLFGFVSDGVALADTVSFTAQIRQAIADGMQLGVTIYSDQDTWSAFVMTTQTRAVSQYVDYAFNSFAQINESLYGAGPAGVYILEGDTDAGSAIYAKVRTGLLDFGARQLKRMDRAYLGYTSDGTLCLRVCTTSPEGAKVEYSYKMVAKPASAPRENRVQIGRGTQAVYWQFELDNSADASRFELHDVVVLPMLLSRRV